MLSVETLEKDELLFLPNKPKDEIEDIFDEHRIVPLTIIPPYDLKSENNTAIMAMTIKNWFPDRTVGIVMPMVMAGRMCQLVRAFSAAGFSPIVFLSKHRIDQHLPRLKSHLSEHRWYHVCDPKFEIKHENVRGRWTRSDYL